RGALEVGLRRLRSRGMGRNGGELSEPRLGGVELTEGDLAARRFELGLVALVRAARLACEGVVAADGDRAAAPVARAMGGPERGVVVAPRRGGVEVARRLGEPSGAVRGHSGREALLAVVGAALGGWRR